MQTASERSTKSQGSFGSVSASVDTSIEGLSGIQQAVGVPAETREDVVSSISRFVNEVCPPEPTREPALRAVQCKMAIEAGKPRPQDYFRFQEAAGRFIEAAKDNDVAALQKAEHDMIFAAASVGWGKSQEAYAAALVAAAKHDAMAATHYILKSRAGISVDRAEWGGTIEAAFITACKFNSYDVVGFYVSPALGEAYPGAVELRPEVMAWGIYRSSDGKSSHELLEKVASINPDVAGIYSDQMAMLRHAECGEDSSIREGIGKIGDKARFVFREAAEKAIRAGHQGSLQILLPEVPLYWLPELVTVAGQQGRVDMVDGIMAQVDGLLKLRSFWSGGQDGGEQYYRENLIGNGIRGAASAGHLETVKELGVRLHSEGRKIAGEAAIEAGQLAVLSWAVSKAGESTESYERESDKKLLCSLMTFALEKGKNDAMQLLLQEKGGLGVSSEHLVKAVHANDEELYQSVLKFTSRRDQCLALRRVCYDLKGRGNKGDSSTPPPRASIIDLFLRTAPLENASAADEREEALIVQDREDACAELGSSNEHEILSTLLRAGAFTPSGIKRAFYNAVGHNYEETFQLLLPRVTEEEINRSFDAVSGRADNWQPLRESRRFLPALISAGANDPQRLVKGAVYLSNEEAWRNEGKASPAALSVINHPAFPAASLNEVLIRTGFNGNTATFEELKGNPEVSRSIVDLYQAVIDKNEEDLARAIPKMGEGEQQALQNAAEYCVKERRFQEGAKMIIEQAPEKLDLPEVLASAVYAKDHDMALLLVTHGAEVTERHIYSAVCDNNETMLRALSHSSSAKVAMSEYLAKHDSETGISEKWASERAGVFAFMRAAVQECRASNTTDNAANNPRDA